MRTKQNSHHCGGEYKYMRLLNPWRFAVLGKLQVTFSKQKLPYCKTMEFPTAMNNVAGCRDAISVSTWRYLSFFKSLVLLMDAVIFCEMLVPVNQFTYKLNGRRLPRGVRYCVCARARACSMLLQL